MPITSMTAQNKVQTKSVGGAIQTASKDMTNPKFKIGTWIKEKNGNRKFRVIALKSGSYILNNQASISFGYAEKIYKETTKDKQTYPLRKVRDPYNMGYMYASIEEESSEITREISRDMDTYIKRFMEDCGCTPEEARDELMKIFLQRIEELKK